MSNPKNKFSKNQITLALVLGLGLILIGTFSLMNLRQKNSSQLSAQNVKVDYSELPEQNRFVRANSEQILDIFEQGSGVVFLGFPSCPWCQKLAPIVNQAAEKANQTQVYYLDIQKARSNNDQVYQKLVGFLSQYLEKDENGEPRIFVPDVTFVKNGQVVARFEQEAAEEGQSSPQTYWTEDRRARAVERIYQDMQKISDQ